MNVGFVSFFAFRPHVEHIYALSKIIEEQGHKVHFLSCDSALSTCYRIELTKGLKMIECAKCTLGGIRSYPASPIDSARKFRSGRESEKIDYSSWGHSSACTILRAENDAAKQGDDFINLKKKLSHTAFESFMITKGRIQARKLDAVVCFNGRMDATRGVLEASKFKKVRFLSVERTWGDGLLLLPDSDCLGLKDIHKIVENYKDIPLDRSQSIRAAKIVASRFLKKNKAEWRAYNLDSIDSEWPIKGAHKKVLILPSSFSEYDGHPEWKMQWKDQFDAFSNILSALELPPDSYIMRGHPLWDQKIGAQEGTNIETIYREWAKEKGMLYINSSSKISTPSLIRQADIVILNGGSAAIEAGLLGKKVISLVETTYKYSDFIINYLSLADKQNLSILGENDADKIIKKTLRFLYSWGFRAMQYTNEIKADDSINYKYDVKLNADRIMKIITSGELKADDPTYPDNELEEDVVINMIRQDEWEKIDQVEEVQSVKFEKKFQRRKAFGFIDSFRNLFALGDQ